MTRARGHDAGREAMTRVERSRWIESGSLAVRTALASLLGSALVIAAPAAVSACSVCTAGRDEENQLAFLLSTLFMSALPLVVIGTIVFVFWRRLQKLEAEEAAREALSAAPSPSGFAAADAAEPRPGGAGRRLVTTAEPAGR